MINTDHLVADAVYVDGLVDWIRRAEQPVGQLLVDDDHPRRCRILGVGEAAAGINVAAIDVNPVRGVDLHSRAHLLVLVGELGAAAEVRGDCLDRRQPLNCLCIIDRERRIATLRTGLVRSIARLESADGTTVDVERRRTRCLEIPRKTLVDAAHHRRHRYNDEHPDRDTHNRQCCPYFVRPNRIDGHANAFERAEDPLRDHRYSFLSASIGSSDAARRAG